MKFVYVDESGGADQGDVFVMAGLMIDAYKLKPHTKKFDKNIKNFLSRYPRARAPRELKTKAIINGRAGWRTVSPDDRKQFMATVCETALECSDIYAIAISLDRFRKNRVDPNPNPHWLATSMYIASRIQKNMQSKPKNKGLTVLIMDDNRKDMPKLSKELYEINPWFDGLYQIKGKGKRNKGKWLPLKDEERFSQIVNTAFAINSEHSSFIQIADVVSYVYRRHLEICDGKKENYAGEANFYSELVTSFYANRDKLERRPKCECVDFYEAIKHPHWKL